MVTYDVLWINVIPIVSGKSYTLSTHTITKGTTLDFNKHCNIKFGEYAKNHESPKPTN